MQLHERTHLLFLHLWELVLDAFAHSFQAPAILVVTKFPQYCEAHVSVALVRFLDRRWGPRWGS